MYDHFTETERANTLVSGKTADPDSDGINNFLEHTMGTDPDEADGAPLSITSAAGQHTVTFPWNPDAGHSYYLQMGDLVTAFADIAFTKTSQTVDGALMISLTPHSSVTVPEDRSFFRIRVE